MSEFIDLAVFLWDTLVMMLLPVVVLMILMVYLYFIMEASGRSLRNHLASKLKEIKRGPGIRGNR